MKTLLAIFVGACLVFGIVHVATRDRTPAEVPCATPIEIVRQQAYNVDTVEYDNGECTIGFYHDDVFYSWTADTNGVTIH